MRRWRGLLLGSLAAGGLFYSTRRGNVGDGNSTWASNYGLTFAERRQVQAKINRLFSPAVNMEGFEAAAKQTYPVGRYSVADAIEKAVPSVVNITLMIQGHGGFHGSLAQSSGSGFILSSSGVIVTNAHVVAEAARNGPGSTSLTVALQDGRTVNGTVVGYDKLSDLALIKVNVDDELPVAELGTSRTLRAGEWVIALGSPLHLRNTASVGIISSAQRESDELGVKNGGPPMYIQTDASINVGNSGGPLLDLDGKVIGINTMKSMGSDGISFALPIDYAKEVIEQLQLRGEARRPYLGVRLLVLTPEILEELNQNGQNVALGDLASEGPGKRQAFGLYVSDIQAKSPSDVAGLRPGDIIKSVDGKPVLTPGDFMGELGFKIDQDVSLAVYRGGKKLSVVVRPEAMPRRNY